MLLNSGCAKKKGVSEIRKKIQITIIDILEILLIPMIDLGKSRGAGRVNFPTFDIPHFSEMTITMMVILTVTLLIIKMYVPKLFFFFTLLNLPCSDVSLGVKLGHFWYLFMVNDMINM